MAKKGRGRRKPVRLIKGTIKEELALVTLGTDTGLLVATDVVDDTSFLLSAQCVYSMSDHAAGEGPLVLYWCHSDYSLTEIEEYIEQQTAWAGNDEVGKEVSRRKIRQIGSFSGEGVSETLNDGRPLKTKIGFVVHEGQGLNLCVYNEDNGANLTTGTLINVNGHCWIKGI